MILLLLKAVQLPDEEEEEDEKIFSAFDGRVGTLVPLPPSDKGDEYIWE